MDWNPVQGEVGKGGGKSRDKYCTSSSFMLMQKKSGISSGLMSDLAHIQTFMNLICYCKTKNPRDAGLRLTCINSFHPGKLIKISESIIAPQQNSRIWNLTTIT